MAEAIPTRFTSMSYIGRAIMSKKLDRAFAAAVRDSEAHKHGAVYQHFAGKVVEFTLAINQLARTAAKNW